MRDTLYDLYPGCGSDPTLGVNEMDAERKEDAHLKVEFYKAPMEDYLPTHGGEVDVVETPPERIEELKALGCRIRKHPKVADILIVEKCGRPVFREDVYVRIQRPGDRDLINERPVEPTDKVRFRRQWELFETGATAGVVGTPLVEMPFINSAMREELAYFGVVTGEQLLGMNDSNSGRFPYMGKIKPHVQRYIDAKAANAPFKARDEKVAALETTVQALQAELASMRTQAKPAEPEKPTEQKRR